MEPTITIIEYLWDNRNEWFHHENPDCEHTFEDLTRQFLDQVYVKDYIEFHEIPGSCPVASFIYRTAMEWDNTIGPPAQKRMLKESAEAYMDQAMKLFMLAGEDDE